MGITALREVIKEMLMKMIVYVLVRKARDLKDKRWFDHKPPLYLERLLVKQQSPRKKTIKLKLKTTVIMGRQR